MIATPGERYNGIACVVELYRDGVLDADQARLILRGLGAQNRTVLCLRHGYEPLPLLENYPMANT